jgi:hypothetical protein
MERLNRLPNIRKQLRTGVLAASLIAVGGGARYHSEHYSAPKDSVTSPISITEEQMYAPTSMPIPTLPETRETHTPTPEDSLIATPSSTATSTPKPTETPTHIPESNASVTPLPTEIPEPTNTPVPTVEPKPEKNIQSILAEAGANTETMSLLSQEAWKAHEKGDKFPATTALLLLYPDLTLAGNADQVSKELQQTGFAALEVDVKTLDNPQPGTFFIVVNENVASEAEPEVTFAVTIGPDGNGVQKVISGGIKTFEEFKAEVINSKVTPLAPTTAVTIEPEEITVEQNEPAGAVEKTAIEVPVITYLGDTIDERMLNVVKLCLAEFPNDRVMAEHCASVAFLEGGIREGGNQMASELRNLFGIKEQGSAGTGSVVYDGNVYSGFAAYSSYNEAVERFHVVLENPRYAGIFEAPTVAEKAQIMLNAGYVEGDSDYVNKVLIRHQTVTPIMETLLANLSVETSVSTETQESTLSETILTWASQEAEKGINTKLDADYIQNTYIKNEPFANWCGYFVAAAFEANGFASVPWAEYGRGYVVGLYNWALHNEVFSSDLTQATPGDLFIMNNGGNLYNHTGIIEWVDADAGEVHTIEGNFADSVVRHTWSIDDPNFTGFADMQQFLGN